MQGADASQGPGWWQASDGKWYPPDAQSSAVPPVPPPPFPSSQQQGPGPNPYSYSNKPSTYLVWAILTTLFCCLPFGVASIVFAAKVDGLWNAGDVHGAMEASRKAKLWAIVSAAVAAVLGVVYLIFIVAVAATL